MHPIQFTRVPYRVLSIVGALLLALVIPTNGFGQAQYNVLYSFCSAANCVDGAAPQGKLVFDSIGNLYGTTSGGGAYQGGTVFELSSSNGSWAENVLYSFCVNDVRNCPDGYEPTAGPTFDSAGNLYGTTQRGGAYGLGCVFELSPPANKDGSWTEAVLWSFGSGNDGQTPFSHLILDVSGNLYGTTSQGGTYGGGTAFQLVPTGGGQWSENILFSFGPDPFNGFTPKAGLTFDKSGNLYGTTSEGGSKEGFGVGVAYKLSPNSQLPWAETVLFRFERTSGGSPLSDVNFDNFGNLYGTLSSWGFNGAGGVFRLAPGRHNTVQFVGQPYSGNPAAGVFISGNALYGTSELGGTEDGGTIFKIRGTKQTVLYSFCTQPGCADGYFPEASLISRGKSLFGTTTRDGANGEGGVVFQISDAAPGHSKSASGKNTGTARVH